MGILGTILGKLGLGNDESPPPTAAPVAAPATASAPAAPAQPKPIDVVDVVADLRKRAAANPQKLNWETSIVDLLKLLDMDSSLASQGARQRDGLPDGAAQRLRQDEHVAAQDGARADRLQRREHPRAPAEVSDGYPRESIGRTVDWRRQARGCWMLDVGYWMFDHINVNGTTGGPRTPPVHRSPFTVHQRSSSPTPHQSTTPRRR